MKPQKTQNNLEQKMLEISQSLILNYSTQSYSKQNTIVLAEKYTQINRTKLSPEINSHIWTTNLQQNSQE